MIEVQDKFVMNSDLANIIWDLSPIIIAMMNEDGRFLYVNRTGQEFWEYTEAELKEKRWQDITHPEDVDADSIMHKMLKEKRQQSYKMCKRYLTKSGRVVWGNMTVHITHGIDKKIIFFLSQVIPLERNGNGDRSKDVPERNAPVVQRGDFDMGSYLRTNLTSIISILLVIVGGIYVFSVDLGANKQKILNLENRIDGVSQRTDNIDKNVQDMMKILMEIKKKGEEKK